VTQRAALIDTVAKPSKKEALEIVPDWLPTSEAINALSMPLRKYMNKVKPESELATKDSI